jgi:hypothetical protein
MTAYLVPLINKPQTLSIALGGTTYNLNVYWCRIGQLWMLDIADVNSNPILGGIPLVTSADLLAQYAYLGFAGALIVQTANDTLALPTFANLGDQGNLYFVTTP